MLWNESSSISKRKLRDYAKSFEDYQYQAVLPSGHTVNCQAFVIYMFATAACLTTSKAETIVLSIIPNIIF